jgi:hypothetical protein
MTSLSLSSRRLISVCARTGSSIAALKVNLVPHLLARLPPRQVRLEHVDRALPVLDRAPAQVRREQNVAPAEERMPGGQRLRARDVQRGARERLRVQRGEQRVRVHRVAASDVHEYCVRAQVRERRG